ncbi:sensor histidine kinase [Marinobacter sp. X15-166B]|uniref:sensor histidine kinase n=1 Tax=Marinobacter sp. X15-166B TaxID=1897620 RepID=UPI00085CDCEE|nr:ATP-binding protein [Marinobacter sp. X15-166B]OEY66259.1 histidine kinase [Marinobacter sp. X15-166B]
MIYRLWAGAAFLLTLLVAWQLGGWAGYQQVERESLEDSFRYSQLIANELKRYRAIPELMAEHPLMLQVLETPTDPSLLLQANIEMKRMAHIVGSSDVYLMDRTGLTIGASNYQSPDSFIGGNFSYRPYFSEVIASGTSAFYFALGAASNVRGLFFSSPVNNDVGDLLGVLSVKVQVEGLESQWRRPVSLNNAEMVVLDEDGISFMASRAQWLYRDFEAGRMDDGKRARTGLRYPRQDTRPISITRLGRPGGVSARTQRLLITDDQHQSREYLSVRTPLPQLDWSLRVMVATEAVLWTRLRFVLAGAGLFLGCVLAWLYLRERYRREAELAQRGEQLELRVRERTAALEASNQRLLTEIDQREQAEAELRETQQELIQAAKLAVLGQMSAGLNHEMNQPLTAIQSYARNSQRFLQRNEHTMVDANLKEIISLCDKMADLTRQFRVFARKSEGRPATVDLRMAVDAALKIMWAQGDDTRNIDLHWDRPTQPVWCHGDLIRIEQVLINLLSNARQAVEQTDKPQITIVIIDRGAVWQCQITDNGPGLPANTEQIFEPFFTTKSVKQGLGLGLSISRQIVDALGGQLTGCNRDDGPGARFVLTLQKKDLAE